MASLLVENLALGNSVEINRITGKSLHFWFCDRGVKVWGGTASSFLVLIDDVLTDKGRAELKKNTSKNIKYMLCFTGSHRQIWKISSAEQTTWKRKHT